MDLLSENIEKEIEKRIFKILKRKSILNPVDIKNILVIDVMKNSKV
jgi:hypothetical protein